MDGLGFLVGGVSLVIAGVALWSTRRLHRELSGVKREQYYIEQKLNALPRTIESAVEPLRIHTALLARGQYVSDLLIRSGQLYHEISGPDAVQLLTPPSAGQSVFLLDVRTNAEFAKRRIPGATLIPVEELEMRHGTEIPAEAKKILVYCAGGDRSRLACDFLSRQNYANVYFLKNGLQGWPGPVEGDQMGALIQISSKSKTLSNSTTTMSSSAQS
ncbi:MAG: rhodanese-like domain-containing protein [Nitrospirota bacterium]|jgi:rhodanese-related sulfurtransferase|nr:rhodanese-like domain-containing protein [Nitrospirota bacterium]